MYYPVVLKTENELNKVLKNQRRTRKSMGVLFVSIWDERCVDLVKKFHSKNTRSARIPLYIVDSFSMPHAFVIFKTNRVPHLVKLTERGVVSEDYFPMICQELGL